MRLYLSPATVENVAQTIKTEVSWDTISQCLPVGEYERLHEAIGQRPLHCWAVTSRYRKAWELMTPGDRVLVKTNGTDAFTWSASICARVHSFALGRRLWPVVGEKPWEFIYFLQDLQSIRKSRLGVVSALGYKPREVIQHFIAVNQERFERVMSVYDTFDGFLASVSDVDDCISAVESKPMETPSGPKAEVLIAPPDYLSELCREIESLKRSPNHQERGHESLVDRFYRTMGWMAHEEIQFRPGRIDVLISRNGRRHIVNEVKRDWSLNRFHPKIRRQAYDYAQKVGAQFIVVTNGDYYALYDKKKGDSYDENFEFDLKLSELVQEDLSKLARFRKL